MRRRTRVFGCLTLALVGITQLLSVLPARAEDQLPPLEEIVEELPSVEKILWLLPSVGDEEVPGGGTISIAVSGDLGACASVSFNGVQVEAAGTLSALGAGTTYNGSVAQVGGADNQSGTNVSSLPDMCVPGDPRSTRLKSLSKRTPPGSTGTVCSQS